jgi:hypothetical protein
MTVTRDLLIGGKETPAASGRTTPDISPFTGETYATVAAAGPEDVERAVAAADAAFGTWAALSPFDRRAVFLRAADVLDARAGSGSRAGLQTGIVHINDQSVGDEPQAPFAAPRRPATAGSAAGGASRRSPTPAGSPWPPGTPATRSEPPRRLPPQLLSGARRGLRWRAAGRAAGAGSGSRSAGRIFSS